ncbi:MAG: SDR family NAD(P)-dependent oxidoreductase, partial [Pseudomonadota bacterium]
MTAAPLLEGRAAVISGAAGARGIGRATARLFAEHGARVAVLDLAQAAPEAAAAALGEGHLGLACDVTDAGACRAAAEAAVAAFGGVDVLVNNAGVTQPAQVMEIDGEGWDRVLDVNLRGTLHLSHALIPHMRARGRGA